MRAPALQCQIDALLHNAPVSTSEAAVMCRNDNRTGATLLTTSLQNPTGSVAKPARLPDVRRTHEILLSSC